MDCTVDLGVAVWVETCSPKVCVIGYTLWGKRSDLLVVRGISEEIHFCVLMSAGEGIHIEYKQ